MPMISPVFLREKNASLSIFTFNGDFSLVHLAPKYCYVTLSTFRFVSGSSDRGSSLAQVFEYLILKGKVADKTSFMGV